MKLFGIIASILGFLVDAVTLLSWFLNPGILASATLYIPIINISLHLETISLIVLIYTFSIFLILGFPSDDFRNHSKLIYALISTATLPFFFIWANTFHNFDITWTLVLSFFSVNLYVLFMLFNNTFAN